MLKAIIIYFDISLRLLGLSLGCFYLRILWPLHAIYPEAKHNTLTKGIWMLDGSIIFHLYLLWLFAYFKCTVFIQTLPETTVKIKLTLLEYKTAFKFAALSSCQ